MHRHVDEAVYAVYGFSYVSHVAVFSSVIFVTLWAEM